jgi:hypothetical protein
MPIARKQKLLSALGAVLLVVLALALARYLTPDELLAGDSRHKYLLKILPAGAGGHHEWLRWGFLIVGTPLFLWALGVFDRR